MREDEKVLAETCPFPIRDVDTAALVPVIDYYVWSIMLFDAFMVADATDAVVK